MFQFAAFASRPYGFRSGYSLRSGFPHSDICGSMLVCQLPAAFRRLSRPSSPVIAKASTTCTSSLDPIALHPRGSHPKSPQSQTESLQPQKPSTVYLNILAACVLPFFNCLRTYLRLCFDCNHNPVFTVLTHRQDRILLNASELLKIAWHCRRGARRQDCCVAAA
jgi:hypothetical protein